MLKSIVMCIAIVMCVIACETGDAIKVVARDGTVCGCMYDETGFHQCSDDNDIQYIVIEASHCN